MNVPNHINEVFGAWFDLVRYDPLSKRKVQKWSGIPLNTVSAYVLYHPLTGTYYLGSAEYTSTRISNHRLDLIKRQHYNEALQKAFDLDGRILYSYLELDDREKAYDLEQELLDKSKGDPLLANINTDARLHGKGRKPTEENLAKLKESQKSQSWIEKNRAITQSPEHAARASAQFSKPVKINGVEYKSAKEASDVLGIHENTIRHRLNSPNPIYSEWIRL